MLEEELKAMQPDMGAIAAYARKDAEYTVRVAELDAATSQRDEVLLQLFIFLFSPMCCCSAQHVE